MNFFNDTLKDIKVAIIFFSGVVHYGLRTLFINYILKSLMFILKTNLSCFVLGVIEVEYCTVKIDVAVGGCIVSPFNWVIIKWAG